VRRPMFLLSMIVVLAGTPLRLAEAAGDLARSMEETDDGWNIDEVDGGVGDDSGATIKADVAHATDVMATADETVASPGWMVAGPGPIARGEDGPPARAAAGSSSRRCALLQCFRC
jgi:hypothetical protein